MGAPEAQALVLIRECIVAIALLLQSIVPYLPFQAQSQHMVEKAHSAGIDVDSWCGLRQVPGEGLWLFPSIGQAHMQPLTQHV